MTHTSADLRPILPALPLDAWEPTKTTLHLWAQIVGKVKLATTAPRNHWWNVPLRVIPPLAQRCRQTCHDVCHLPGFPEGDAVGSCPAGECLGRASYGAGLGHFPVVGRARLGLDGCGLVLAAGLRRLQRKIGEVRAT
jgi:hypothetical protein